MESLAESDSIQTQKMMIEKYCHAKTRILAIFEGQTVCNGQSAYLNYLSKFK